MMQKKGRAKPHECIVNIGLFRSGSTTLAEAAKVLGLKTYRKFPKLAQGTFKEMLENPEKAILDWLSSEHEEFIKILSTHDLVCDGWFALLPFLPLEEFVEFAQALEKAGVRLVFVATRRDVKETIQSELQHWVVHNLEKKAGMNFGERNLLEDTLRGRAQKHRQKLEQLETIQMDVKILDLSATDSWPKELSAVSKFDEGEWRGALEEVGRQNANPPLPVEGILLTMRLGSSANVDRPIAQVKRLLDQIEGDSLCRYIIVVGLDADEIGSEAAIQLNSALRDRATGASLQCRSFQVIKNPFNPPHQPFAICSAWNEMASCAWKEGADWVVLLGDDITVKGSCHYRAIYRCFLDVSQDLKVPFGFGCPWWNDESFPGFPSFPCVGKAHHEIFRALIPESRQSDFKNQDLDPYLHRMYIKFKASQCVKDAVLSNGFGGNIGAGEARYQRVAAIGWKDFVIDDTEKVRAYLHRESAEMPKNYILLDVVVPSHRIQLDYLTSICSLEVPEYMIVSFIIIIDNPTLLLEMVAEMTGKCIDSVALTDGEQILEDILSKKGNSVRVRCNENNLGASASRNRGLDESSAEFVLNLDDDLIPDHDLLSHYGQELQDLDDSVVGLIGLVHFPRSPTLPLKHAAVLMSYLTFMFEIAEHNRDYNPAWGVTANILFRRNPVRFDLAYAKSKYKRLGGVLRECIGLTHSLLGHGTYCDIRDSAGGGEDVDYSLRVAKHFNNGVLLPVRKARVTHPFWPGSVWTLASHFFNWAIGDGSLFKRFPEYRYWSFPNLPEMIALLLPLSLPVTGLWMFLVQIIPLFLLADFVVDRCNTSEYKHRCLLLQKCKECNDADGSMWRRSTVFYTVAHMLANLYVVVLEGGRLWGHFTRLEPWYGFCQRFDWHCGRLPNARANFRRREAFKFLLFAVIWLVHVNIVALMPKGLTLNITGIKPEL